MADCAAGACRECEECVEADRQDQIGNHDAAARGEILEVERDAAEQPESKLWPAPGMSKSIIVAGYYGPIL